MYLLPTQQVPTLVKKHSCNGLDIEQARRHRFIEQLNRNVRFTGQLFDLIKETMKELYKSSQQCSPEFLIKSCLSRFENCADATENDIDKKDDIDTKRQFLFKLCRQREFLGMFSKKIKLKKLIENVKNSLIVKLGFD